MRSNIPHIALSSISAKKQHQTDREFSMRVAFVVGGFILSTLSRMIAQRFSMDDRFAHPGTPCMSTGWEDREDKFTK